MCFVLLQEVVFSLALEVAFPSCAIIQQPNKMKEMVRDWEVQFMIITGSRAEGLAIENEWGHPESDVDTMMIYREPLVVHVPQAHQSPECTNLRYKPEGCPAAYCKIEVIDVHALLGTEVSWVKGLLLNESCVHESKEMYWLHAHNTLKRLEGVQIKTEYIMPKTISGPALQASTTSEYIPALVCCAPHPDMDRLYIQRPRHGWPSPKQLEFIKHLPMLLVLVGHKLSRADEIPLQARLSWSLLEIFLISELPQKLKQAYIALKYAFKYFIKIMRGEKKAGDGRSHVGSYHLKTVFLRYLERTPPAMVRSQLGLILGLLYDLDSYLKAGQLPHYFLPTCNLLATVGLEERCIARNVINHILSDPLRAILTCPTDPNVIYGDVPTEALVATFYQVSSQSTSPSNCGDLFRLLVCLDDTRRERYLKQLFKDEVQALVHDSPPRFRAELTGLVNMLWEQML